MFVVDPKDILWAFLFELVIGGDLDGGAFDENNLFATIITLEKPGSNLWQKYKRTSSYESYILIGFPYKQHF